MKLIQYILTACLATLLLSSVLFAQEELTGVAKVKAEMEAAYGVYPAFMKALPEHLQESAWELMKDTQNPNAAISPKNSELIGLAVAAQVPCNFCVYYHTNAAKMFGASDAEIKEAIAKAADSRFWSTVLNGSGTEFDTFKTEMDAMFAFVQAQMEKQTSKK